MEQKKLSLKKETIASLSNVEQSNFAGGGGHGYSRECTWDSAYSMDGTCYVCSIGDTMGMAGDACCTEKNCLLGGQTDGCCGTYYYTGETVNFFGCTNGC